VAGIEKSSKRTSNSRGFAHGLSTAAPARALEGGAGAAVDKPVHWQLDSDPKKTFRSNLACKNVLVFNRLEIERTIYMGSGAGTPFARQVDSCAMRTGIEGSMTAM